MAAFLPPSAAALSTGPELVAALHPFSSQKKREDIFRIIFNHKGLFVNHSDLFQ